MTWQFHSTAGGPPRATDQISGSHPLNQRPRSVQLGQLATDQAATDSQEQDWAAANTEAAVISGFQIEQDEPLMVVWSSPEQQRYTGFSIVLDDDAPEEDTDQAVIEVGYLVRLGWGT